MPDFYSDIATQQNNALENSALLARDGTRLTGKLKVATARVVLTEEQAIADVKTHALVRIPGSGRILRGQIALLKSAGSDYSARVFVREDDSDLATFTEDSNPVYPLVPVAEREKVETSQWVDLELTAVAAIPVGHEFEISIFYATVS